MWKVLLLLVVAVCAFGEGKKLKNLEGTVSDKCIGTMRRCAMRTMSDGRCGTVWNGLLLRMIDSDTDNSCVVDEDDMERYFETRMDEDDDGNVCKDEWTNYMVKQYGLTDTTAQGIFMQRYPGKRCADIDDMEEVKDKTLRKQFRELILQELAKFCSMGTNLDTNSDCWGLVTVCKEMVTSSSVCRSFDMKGSTTLYERLRREQIDLDDDPSDGVITARELNRALQQKFNTEINTRGCVSENEWVALFTQQYKFTPAFARAYYDGIRDVDNNNCIDINDFPAYSRGNAMNAADHTRNVMTKLIHFCENSLKLYHTNKDCVSLADTCRAHFPTLAACTDHFSNKMCGIQAYKECIRESGLPKGNCSDSAGMHEVKFEILKINNQINTTCVANNLNGADSFHTIPAFLLTCLALLTLVAL